LAQPALTLDSYLSHGITLFNSSFIVRFTNFVEIMAPVFSRDFLVKCAGTFGDNLSGYGLDSLWPTWITEPRAIGIIDSCLIKHTRPVGGPNYKALQAAGTSTHEEYLNVQKKYGLPPLNTVVTGGIDSYGRELMLSDGYGGQIAELLLRGYLPGLADRSQYIIEALRPVLQYLAPPQKAAPAPSHLGCQAVLDAIKIKREKFEAARSTGLGLVAAQLMSAGNHAAATMMLSSALSEGEAGPLWNDWATIEYSCGNVIRAELGYRRALKLDSSFRQSAINLSALLLTQGRVDEALPVIAPHIPALDTTEKQAIRDLIVKANQQQNAAALDTTSVTAKVSTAYIEAFRTVLALIPDLGCSRAGMPIDGVALPLIHYGYFVNEGNVLLQQLPADVRQQTIDVANLRPAMDPRLTLVVARSHMFNGNFARAASLLRAVQNSAPNAPVVASMIEECRQATEAASRAAAPATHCANWREAVALLRQEPLERLRDLEYLELEFLPRLGLNGELLHEFPSFLYPYCGSGLKSWQYPGQFAPYLRWLSEQNIESYLEIGCRHGGTFIVTLEYCNRFHPIKHAACVDLMDSPILREYMQTRSFDYRVESSTSASFLSFSQSRIWDLVLIDGDHSLEGVKADFEAIKNNARLIALHDICSSVCPGVEQMWNDIKSSAPGDRLVQWCHQYPEVTSLTGGNLLGIGVYQNEACQL